METATERLSWQIDVGSLSPREAKTLRDAAAAVEHWLDVWRVVVVATLPASLAVEVTAAEGAGATVERMLEQDRSVRIIVPQGLVGADPATLRMALLDSVLAAVEEAAQRWPYEVPPQMWQPDDSSYDEMNLLAITLETLQPEELLLLGRLAGVTADEESRFDELNEYVLDRAERSGLAVVDEAESGSSAAAWVVGLTITDSIDGESRQS